MTRPRTLGELSRTEEHMEAEVERRRTLDDATWHDEFINQKWVQDFDEEITQSGATASSTRWSAAQWCRGKRLLQMRCRWKEKQRDAGEKTT